jgi:tripartite-type tricarboxylate transporter receptor subunit TctC
VKKLVLAALCAAAVANGASAQGWPAKPVRLISQFPPGGGTDLIARNLIPGLSEAFGQNFILEHKAGAAGNIAADHVAKSAADGYTILIANNTIVIQAALPQKLSFDVVKDFTPVGIVASTPVALAVHPSQPVKSVQDLITLVRAQPGKVAYSSCGTGTAMHLAGELFKQLASIDMTHVPYRGCGPAIVDGISGQVPVLFNTITNTSPQAKAGRLRIVAIASATRGAGEPAARDRRTLEFRAQPHREAPRGIGAPRRSALRRARRHPGGVRRARQGRHRQVGEGGARRQHQAGVSMPLG